MRNVKMKKRFSVDQGLRLLGLAALLAATPAWAEDGPGAAEPQRPERHDWRRIDERLRALETKTPEVDDDQMHPGLGRKVRINGLLEAEAFHRKGYSRDDEGNPDRMAESDLALATVALDFHAELNDWARTHILLLWEDGAGPVDVDEAVIALGNPEKFPVAVNAGKLYVPFGVYNSFMIRDPLTLELGETNETAVQIGFEQAGFHGSVYAFNGDVNEAGRDNTINGFGASAGYAFEKDKSGLKLGVDYLNNLADSDGLTGALEDGAIDITKLNDYVAGLGAHLHLTHGPYTFYSEYLAALDNFADGELEFGARGAKPKAWHLEAGYTRELVGKETTFALGYQATAEAVALDLPEKRYLAAMNVSLADGLSWAVEFAHDKDYNLEDGGTGDDANMITTQFALQF
jgi:hypothetical protein